MNKSEAKGNTISVVIISLAGKIITLLSKTMYLAIFGAANPLLNVYDFALNIPNVVFNCIGTALNTVIIPIYTALLAKNENIKAKKFLDNIISISMVLITALVSVGIVIAPLIALVAGNSIDAAHKEYLIFALRILMPVMVFYGLNYIFQGILQSHGSFKLPAAVSAPSGIVIILYLIFFADKWGVTGLIFATVISLFTQPAIMLPAIKKLGYKYAFSFDYKDDSIKTAGALTLPVLASVSSYQLNFLFNNAMALNFGTVSIMTYSQMLVQTFMLTIVYAICSVYFPRLSAQWATGNKAEYGKSLAEIIEYTLFLILPAATGFFLLRYGIMDFLLNWKVSASSDPVLAGNLLGLYSIGIIAISLKEVLDKAFYSSKDTKTPAVFGFIIMAVNICVTLLLLDTLGAYAMPAAYCLSAFCGTFGLMFMAEKKVKILNKNFLINIGKIIFATALMLIAAYFAQIASDNIYVINEVLTKLSRLAIPAAAGAAVYIAVGFFIKIPATAFLFKAK